MTSKKHALYLSMSLFTIGHVWQAQAAQLEEVFVTARRTDENVQEVPLAVTAMTTAELEKRGVSSVTDLVKGAPSVQLSAGQGRPDAVYFGIRGQKADDVLLTQDQAIAVIVGDVPLNWPYGVGQIGMLDVASVQVVKGPQGTLFGKNSTGGAIIITPATPEQDTAGNIKLGVGNYNLHKIEGMFNTPLTDTLAARVAVAALKRDGTIENLDGGDDFRQQDSLSGRLSFMWNPLDNLSSLLVFEGVDSKGSGSGGRLTHAKPAAEGPTLAGAAYQNAVAAVQNEGFFTSHSELTTRGGGYNDLQMWGVLNTTTYDFSDELTLKNIIGYRGLNYDGLEDLDKVHRSMTSTNIQWWAYSFTDATSFTEELQLIGSTDHADWIAGVYYAHTDGRDGAINNQWTAVGNTSRSGPGGGVTNDTMAIFGQSIWHVTDRFNVTTGLRYTRDYREVVFDAQNIPNPPFQTFSCLFSGITPTPTTPEQCSQKYDESFEKPTWTLSADYRLSDAQLLYAALKRGYRSGGFSGRASTPVAAEPYEPETVDELEIGHKLDGSLAGQPLRINTAIFNQDYKNIQRGSTFIGNNGQVQNSIINAAKAKIYGGEVEFHYNITDDLELSGFGAYIHASYDEWIDHLRSGESFDRTDNRFPGIPERSYSLTGTYTLPVDQNIGVIAINANMYWQSEIALWSDNKVDPSNLDCKGSMQDSYRLYSANVNWSDFFGITGLSLNAWGKNLANKHYYSSGTCLYNSVGITQGWQGEPRTYGLDISYAF